jgi:fumarate reductase flavoprotein subunit
MHNVVPGARAYITTLQTRFQQLGGVILCNAGVERLVCKDRRIVGVVAIQSRKEQEFQARRGVVLAAGDYANSPELIKNFKGDRFSEIEGINPFSTGDGHRLAEQAGARLINMDVTYGPELRFVPPSRRSFLNLLPTGGIATKLMGWLMPYVPKFVVNAFIRRLLVTWQHPENALFDDGAILVNQLGRRFCDERDSPSREIAIAAQPGKLCYILLDQRLIQRYSAWPHFISTAPQIAYAYVADYLRLRADIAVRARTLEALAKLRGISASALQATIDSFNMQRGESNIAPLEGSDWVLLGPAKAYFTTTEGGAAINERFQVLNDQGTPIEGLYAVGQNGLGGQILWGHGLHIAWAMTSGRLCGRVLTELGEPQEARD